MYSLKKEKLVAPKAIAPAILPWFLKNCEISILHPLKPT